MMIAVIEVCKVVLSSIPNIELTSFWLIMFTLLFGKKTAFAVPVFILLEGCMYGFGLWWVMYLYSWPLLVLTALLFRKQTSPWFWSVFSGVFGLLFGFFCALPYFFIGFAGGGLLSGLSALFTWWVAGIPFDITHCIGNFVIMLLLYKPIRQLMDKIKED